MRRLSWGRRYFIKGVHIMIIRDRYKSKELAAGAIWKYNYYYVVGAPSNNGTVKCKDVRGRRVVRHLAAVDIIKT